MASRLGVAQSYVNQGDGTDAWANTAAILVQDGVNATADASTKNDTVQTLRCTNFNFGAFPPNAIITGFVVDIWRSSSVANAAQDATIRLVLAGAIAGQNKATATAWPTANTQVSYGTANDLWGNPTFANSLITANNIPTTFGLDVKPGVNQTIVRIDHIRMFVHYRVDSMLFRNGGVWGTSIPNAKNGVSFTPTTEAYCRVSGTWRPVQLT